LLVHCLQQNLYSMFSFLKRFFRRPAEPVVEDDLLGNPAPYRPIISGKQLEYFKAQLRSFKPFDEKRLKEIQEAKEFFNAIRK